MLPLTEQKLSSNSLQKMQLFSSSRFHKKLSIVRATVNFLGNFDGENIRSAESKPAKASNFSSFT